jgi:hypothetical protein
MRVALTTHRYMHDASGAEYSLQAEGGDAYHGADSAEG